MIALPAILTEVAQRQPYPLLFATVSGAHLYGFPSPDSDFDLRGAHILPVREIVGLHEPERTIQISRIEDGIELDLATHDIEKFFRMLLKKNGYVLEQVCSPLVVLSTPEFEELRSLAPQCVTRHHAHHYLGFAKTQWGLFAKERPPRVKPLLYVYRVLLTGIHMMRTGEIEAHLPALNEQFRLPYIGELIERKTLGAEKETLEQADAPFHEGEYLRLTRELEKASGESHLPELPAAAEPLNDLLIRIRIKYGGLI